MGAFFALLLIVLAVWLLWPLVRIATSLFRARRTWRDIMERAEQARHAHGFSDTYSRDDAPRPGRSTRRPNRFSDDDGEYVAFEDLPTDPSATAAGPADDLFEADVESQVVDVKWEDLPNKRDA